MKPTLLLPAIALTVLLLTLNTTATAPKGYKLVWQDEFESTQLDATKWVPQSGARHDAINTAEAVQVKSGSLIITTYTENGKHHTGFLWSKGKYEATFGYYEARIRFNTTPGQWAAFWLQTPTMGKPLNDPAKAGTEIDIVEHRVADTKGKDISNMYVMNLHWDGYKEDHKKDGSQGAPKPGATALQGNWHDYAVLWTPEEYIFYLDGVEQWRTKKGVSQRSEYLLLSCELRLTGWAGKTPEAGFGTREKSKTKMEVDWVRVYQLPGQNIGQRPAKP